MKLIKSFCGRSREPHGMGNLLEMVLLLRMSLITPPAPVTCACHLWQKKGTLAAGGKVISDKNSSRSAIFLQKYLKKMTKLVSMGKE
jgi:hypothetical protein